MEIMPEIEQKKAESSEVRIEIKVKNSNPDNEMNTKIC